MKSKKTFLFVIGLIAALGAGFLIGISVNYPKANKSELAGTFGKAEKYHKVQMTAKDIQLRSELLKDTAQLKSMIQGLMYFSVFTGEVSADIDLSALAFKAQGMGTLAADAEKIKALQDYSEFIRNNNKTLNATVALLTGFYLNDTANQSQDIEKNLREFANYVNQLNEKNLVLVDALSGMDNFMLGNKTLQAHKTEIQQLKSIRDQLLVKGVQLGGLIGNKEMVGSLLNSIYSSQEKLSIILGKEQLGFILGKEQLQVVMGKEQLQVIMGKEQIQSLMNGKEMGVIAGKQDLGGKALVWDKAGLQFIIADKSQLGVIILGTADLQGQYGMQPLCIFGTESLNVLLNLYSLRDIIQSQQMGAGYTASTLNRIFALDNLQVIIFSTGGMGSFLNVLASSNLGLLAL